MVKAFYVGAALHWKQDLYVERDEDDLLFAILNSGQHCNLHAGRQCGKTSLMLKTMDRLEAEGHVSIDVDFSLHANAPTLLEAVESVGRELSVHPCLEGFTIPAMEQKSPEDALQVLLLELNKYVPSNKKLYLFIDELDSLRRFTSSQVYWFLHTIRTLAQARPPAPCLQGIIVCLVSVLEPTNFYTNFDVGGLTFSLGQGVYLPPFPNTRAIHNQLKKGFPSGRQEEAISILPRIVELSGGHAFLTSLFCFHIQRSSDYSAKFSEVKQEALSKRGTLVTPHLGAMRKQLLDHHQQLNLISRGFRQLLKDNQCDSTIPSDAITTMIKLGLVVPSDDGNVQISNPIYQHHLDEGFWDQLLSEKQARTGQESHNVHVNARAARIGLIMAGGTIGMIQDKGKAVFPTDYEAALAPILENVTGFAQITKLEVVCQKDGINITPQDWVEMTKAVHRMRGQVDGIVIAQGTDTMGYSASATAFALGPALDIPVVFTGAQATMSTRHGDTTQNLVRSCWVAAQQEPEKRITEVSVCFDDVVLRACRAVKTDDYRFAGFASPAWPPLARISEELLVNTQALRKHSTQTTPQEPTPHFAETILNINIVPGLKPALFMNLLDQQKTGSQPIDGIILGSPGIGNIPSLPEYNFRDFIERATDQGIPVLIVSLVPVNPLSKDLYTAATDALGKGAIHAGNMTEAAALTKFSWAIGAAKLNKEISTPDRVSLIKERMKTNYIGEFGEFGEFIG